jgi:hypothetical protein
MWGIDGILPEDEGKSSLATETFRWPSGPAPNTKTKEKMPKA